MKKFVLLALCLVAANVTAIGPAAAAKDRPVLAVAEFTNAARAYWWRGGVGWELADMLTNELAATGKFEMVERSKLSHVLREQNLGASGRVSEQTAARIGKLTGARYLVMGKVSSFERNVQGTGGGFGFKGIRIGGKKEDAYIAVDLRVVDTTTGRIQHVRTVEARTSGGGLKIGIHRGGFSGNLKQHAKTPTGKAIRAVLVEASDYLACVMVYKDDCVNEYGAKEKRRRDRTKGSIKLD